MVGCGESQIYTALSPHAERVSVFQTCDLLVSVEQPYYHAEAFLCWSFENLV